MIKRNRIKKDLFPAWEMPSDPIKAVFWFMFWLLRVLAKFFWVPIIGMVLYEVILNWKSSGATSGLVAGFVTCIIGLGIWTVLYTATLFLNIGTTVSRVISDVNRMQQGMPSRRPAKPANDITSEKNIVDSTITDLEEERRKRRSE